MSKEIINNTVIHKPTDIFGRVLVVKDDLLEELFTLEFQDLSADDNFCSYNEKSIFEDDFSECIINFLNDEYFSIFIEEFEKNPICIEIYQYSNYNNLGENEFNKIYFADYVDSELDFIENKSLRNVHFTDWENIVENGTIPEHNIFYDSLPVDNSEDPPKKYKPDNFNFIKFSKKYFHEIISSLYDRNIDNPVRRENGTKPTSNQNSRKPVAYDGLTINNKNTDVLLSINEVKSSDRTINSFRRSLSKTLSNKGYTSVHQTKLKIINNKIHVYYITNEKIIINNYFNDNAISFQKHENDSKEGIKSILIQDSNDDSLIYLNKTNSSRKNEWKFFEGLEDVNGDGGDEDNPIPPSDPDYKLPLQQKADEDIEDGEDKSLTEIEMNILDYNFFSDINCGQIIELTNFGKEYDGEYRIDEISAVINKTYTSYSFDKLTKVVKIEEE